MSQDSKSYEDQLRLLGDFDIKVRLFKARLGAAKDDYKGRVRILGGTEYFDNQVNTLERLSGLFSSELDDLISILDGRLKQHMNESEMNLKKCLEVSRLKQ